MFDQLGEKLNNIDAKSLAKIMLTVGIIGVIVISILIVRIVKVSEKQKAEIRKNRNNTAPVSEQMDKLKNEIIKNQENNDGTTLNQEYNYIKFQPNKLND